MAKRRLKIVLDHVFSDEGANRGEKRQRKLIVSMDRDATVGDLRSELNKEIGTSSPNDIALEIEGFELRSKDGLDVVEENETIHALVKSSPADVPSILSTREEAQLKRLTTRDGIEQYELDQNVEDGIEPGRLQICLVTAELARRYAKSNIKSTSEPTNGLLAFNGEYISGNTTLSVLRQEAARLFHWGLNDSDSMIVDEKCDHPPESSCSCPIALQLEQNGLYSNLHCRFTVDGTRCPNDACPYSHSCLDEYIDGSIPPHCTICLEALGFPCPSCMQTAIASGIEFSSQLCCPLIQNAGCGHLHHAHCLGTRKDSDILPCPSGCPLERFHREPRLLDADVSSQYLILVWDGDKIDRIPIHGTRYSRPETARTFSRISTDEIIQLVEQFLVAKNFKIPNLSLRIHARDPVTESVRYFQSTLVSVCSSTAHTNQSYRRFGLFYDFDSTDSSSGQGDDNRDSENNGSIVDFHTSLGPIVACGCTALKQLFPSSPSSTITLYVVKRSASEIDKSAVRKGIPSSKQGIYLADDSWQPSIVQSARGMAALLSSLYLFAHSVSIKGRDAEHRVLAMVYSITRFPPAVRALGTLLMNRSPSPEARAALSESLYHCLLDFSGCGPVAIVQNATRIFETVRILLAHLISAVDAKPSLTPEDVKPLEEVSLGCSISQKRLIDPVLMGSSVVERAVYDLHQPGGELYKPVTLSTTETGTLDGVPNSRLRQIISHSRALSVASTVVLNIDNIGPPPPTCSLALDSVARNFAVAIRYANSTSLATRGPLELKSPAIVAPQVVLDKDGHLAVFTGRGCGSTRDVNFFRPINGGDTEVDVNDVAHGLQAVITTRIAEDTWQVDSYEGVSIISNRPPDEAIILCLDLSESMNKSSGVNPPRTRKAFDHEEESRKAVSEAVKDMNDEQILEEAKTYMTGLNPICHRIWKSVMELNEEVDDVLDSDDYYADSWHDYFDIISQLGTIARREVLRLDHITEGGIPFRNTGRLQLACFASAAEEQVTELADYLEDFLSELPMNRSGVVGHEPFDVPLELLDPRTGDMLLNPVWPSNAPEVTIFVNEANSGWLEEQSQWPIVSYTTRFESPDEVKGAVEKWMSGDDLLPFSSDAGKGKMRSIDVVPVTLRHDGQETTWNLSKSTSVRTLYALANRVTAAKYRHFTLRHVRSKVPISMYGNQRLGLTDLAEGGTVEISRADPHLRWSYEVELEDSNSDLQHLVLLPQGTPMLAVLSCFHAWIRAPLSSVMLWHGLTDVGDGVRRGKVVNYDDSIGRFASGNERKVSLECRDWFWIPSGAQKERESSRDLSRLDLLKELFNIFLNRAASFDTSVSLVLGLVTFSDDVKVPQEPTPVFENFRQALDTVSATGDTAIYDALDTARRLLSEYRPDLPKLRRRIIIVTDGQDTSSTATAREVCYALQRDKIVVDSVQVGGHSDEMLHAISVATGGYRLCPKTSLSDALSIFDLETMLHSGERPPRPPRPAVTSDLQLSGYGNKWHYPIDVVTIDKFPKRAEHTRLQEGVKPAAVTSTGLAQSNHKSDDRIKRIMRELKALVTDPHPQIDLYVNEKDISFLKIILEAPNDVEACPYKGGCFLLTCEFPPEYPRDPPEIRFTTFILHPNVSKQGKVCIAELGRLWSSDITVKELFSLVFGLLLEPDLDNPLEIQASLKYYDDDGTYALAAADAVKEHASKTRQQWRSELEDQDDM